MPPVPGGCPQCRGGRPPCVSGFRTPSCSNSWNDSKSTGDNVDPESEFTRPRKHTGFLGCVCGNLSPIRKRFWTENRPRELTQKT